MASVEPPPTLDSKPSSSESLTDETLNRPCQSDQLGLLGQREREDLGHTEVEDAKLGEATFGLQDLERPEDQQLLEFPNHIKTDFETDLNQIADTAPDCVATPDPDLISAPDSTPAPEHTDEFKNHQNSINHKPPSNSHSADFFDATFSSSEKVQSSTADSSRLSLRIPHEQELDTHNNYDCCFFEQSKSPEQVSLDSQMTEHLKIIQLEEDHKTSNGQISHPQLSNGSPSNDAQSSQDSPKIVHSSSMTLFSIESLPVVFSPTPSSSSVVIENDPILISRRFRSRLR